MKKALSVLLVLLLVSFAAFAGGSKESAAAASADDPYAGLGNYTMMIGHSQPADNPRSISLEKFVADVEEKTNGHVTVQVFGNGQLGTEKEMLEQVVIGTLQGMRGGQFDFTPRLLMFTLPFLAQTREEVTALLHSDLAAKVCAEAEAETGTVIINLCDAGGFRQFSNSRHPITKPSDLQGLKMRTAGMETIDRTFRALGATTTPVPYSDLYMALRTGVADGQENPWTNVSSMKFYEVQNYFTEVNYQFHPDPFYVNASWWNSLPEEFQTIIRECATEMGTYNDQLVDELQSSARQTVVDAGGEIYVPTAEELQAFKDAVQVVYQQCIDSGILTAEELAELQEIVANN